MSKLSQLKQEAYLAGKKREWDRAVTIYERILDLDKNNPTVVNEIGDLCLRAGDNAKAIQHFLTAAAKYRTSGLLNNAVAIYKKILRYDEANQNAHWYLAETRASQGLNVEGEAHGLMFLASSGKVTGEIKEIFLKRCKKLFELFGSSEPIMEKLLQIFRMWDMNLEANRTRCLLACMAWDKGSQDEARQAAAEAVAQVPEIRNYPEYAQLMTRIDPTCGKPAGLTADVNALDLGASTPAGPGKAAAPAAAFGELELGRGNAAADEVADATSDAGDDDDAYEIAIDDEPDETSFAGIPFRGGKPVRTAAPDPAVVEKDDEGCISLDLDGDGADFDALIAQAAADAAGQDADEDADEDAVAPEAAAVPAAEPEAPVDLLAEILAEDDGALSGSASSQLDTITQEIGAQMGGAATDDPVQLYDMGMVYLDMGLFEQAAASFRQAARHDDFQVRAREMWGITLMRAGRSGEAVDVLTAGLSLPAEGSREYLGLLYHLAGAHEQAGQQEEALQLLHRLHELEPGYLDVGKRLAQLTTL